MTILRICCGVLSFGLAALLCIHVVLAFPQIVVPTFRQLGHEPDAYLTLNIGPFSFSGWQLIASEIGLVLLTICFVVVGAYALTPDDRAA